MIDSRIIVGSWSPLDNVLPKVNETTTFGMWYVKDSGNIENLELDFSQGDWLIYVKDESGSENWYKQTGGAAVFDINNSMYVPDTGTYTRFRLDNNGNIIKADFLEEKDIPKHTHELKDIKLDELTGKVQSIVKEMFQNKVNSSVTFNYNKVLNTISAEVNIDGDTIKKNDYGELESTVSGGGNPDEFTGTIKIEQVENLPEEIKRIDDTLDKKKIITTSTSGLKSTDIEGSTMLNVKVDGFTIKLNSQGELCTSENAGEDCICGNHVHTTDQITNLDEYVDDKLEKARWNPPVESIPIDNETIIVNKYRQLEAVTSTIKKHYHIMKDIEDLRPEIADTWASEQVIQNTTSDGQDDFTGMKIEDTINTLNKRIKELTLEIENLKNPNKEDSKENI